MKYQNQRLFDIEKTKINKISIFRIYRDLKIELELKK